MEESVRANKAAKVDDAAPIPGDVGGGPPPGHPQQSGGGSDGVVAEDSGQGRAGPPDKQLQQQ